MWENSNTQSKFLFLKHQFQVHFCLQNRWHCWPIAGRKVVRALWSSALKQPPLFLFASIIQHSVWDLATIFCALICTSETRTVYLPLVALRWLKLRLSALAFLQKSSDLLGLAHKTVLCEVLCENNYICSVAGLGEKQNASTKPWLPSKLKVHLDTWRDQKQKQNI